MREPKLLIGFNDNGDLIMHRSDGGGRPLPSWLTLDLYEFESKGYLDVAQRVGGMALRYLAGAFPEEFAKHPLLIPPTGPHFDEPALLVSELISRSHSGRTTKFVAAIDQLFETDAKEFARGDSAEFWRDQRACILENYGSKLE